MFLQIWIDPTQRKLLRILWRESPNDDVQIFELNTVTFGCKSSPFLAIRCVVELAKQNKVKFPRAAKVLKRDIYVDDTITGADSIEELLEIKSEVDQVLRSGGFELRKWASNTPALLTNSSSDVEYFEINPEASHKMLGIIWTPTSDTLQCAVKLPTLDKPITKRSILSATAQIYDPLGLFAPVTVIAKILLQGLWTLKLSWDTTVPPAIQQRWSKFCNQLKLLTEFTIPRRVITGIMVEFHCFADASQKAYGGCVYLKSVDAGSKVSVRLLIARSRVAPLKSVTIPKLELCAASLLSDLYQKVKAALSLPDLPAYFWSDSTIVLGWLRADPRRWKTFVCNRVTKIQEQTNSGSWYHVPTQYNPADLISRGVLPEDLLPNKLWWSGPSWLCNPAETWPADIEPELLLPEERSNNTTTLNTVVALPDLSLITR